jgi:hypothetical protein
MRSMRRIVLDVPLRLERLHRSQLGKIEEGAKLDEVCGRSFAEVDILVTSAVVISRKVDFQSTATRGCYHRPKEQHDQLKKNPMKYRPIPLVMTSILWQYHLR